jgi:hypothetical protein
MMCCNPLLSGLNVQLAISHKLTPVMFKISLVIIHIIDREPYRFEIKGTVTPGPEVIARIEKSSG